MQLINFIVNAKLLPKSAHLVFLILLTLLSFCGMAHAVCTKQGGQPVSIPPPSISVANDLPIGSVLARIEVPSIDNSNTAAICDASGGKLRYVAYDFFNGACTFFEGKCLPMLRDNKRNWIEGLGIRIRGQVYENGQLSNSVIFDGATISLGWLRGNEKIQFNQFSPLTIEFVKTKASLQSAETLDAILLNIQVETNSGASTIVQYRLGPFKINIAETQCQITYPHSVSLGTIATATLTQTGTSTNVPFTLSFTNCPSKSILLTMENPSAISNTDGILPNEAPGSDVAKNIGVQIYNPAKQQAFPLNKAIIVGNQPTFSLPLVARMYHTGGKISPSKVHAVATLLISYE